MLDHLKTRLNPHAAEAAEFLELEPMSCDQFGLPLCEVYVADDWPELPVMIHRGGASWRKGRIKILLVCIELEDGTRTLVNISYRNSVRMV